VTLVNDQPPIDSSAGVVAPRRSPAGLFGKSISAGVVAAWVAVATLVGAGVRLHHLAGRSLWIDEAASTYFATMPWRPFLRLLWGYQGNMTLYYFLLRAWMHLGDSESVVRGLSVLFGILAIPAVYVLGTALFDRATGLIAAALLSVHSFHVAFSQEARGYSLLIFLLVLTTYVLVRVMESKQELWRWMLFAVVAALCVYAHIFAVLVLAAHALAIVFPRPFRVRLKAVVVTAFVFGILVAPMAGFVLLHHSDQIAWVPKPAPGEIFEFLKLLTSQGGILLMVLYFALCGLAFWPSAAGSALGRENWALRLLGLWVVLPPALTLAASVIKPLFFPRYMVMCVPALVILAARGIVRFSQGTAVNYWAATSVLVLVLILSAWGTHHYFLDFPNETSDWRSAVNYILERQQPGDGVVFYIPNDYAYLYYVRRAEGQHEVTEAPDVVYPPPSWRPPGRDEIERDISGRKRIWLVLHIEESDPQISAVIQSTLAERLRAEGKQVVFAGQDLIKVELFSGTPTVR